MFINEDGKLRVIDEDDILSVIMFIAGSVEIARKD